MDGFSNVYRTRLSADVAAIDTEITVASVTGAPTPPFRIFVGRETPPIPSAWELMRVTAIVGRVLTVDRAYEAIAGVQTAHDHARNDVVAHVLTAGVLDDVLASNANDPSAGEKAALAGTSGTPGSGNKYVTDGDARNTNARTPSAHDHTTGDGSGVLTNDEHDGYEQLTAIATPSTPAAGKLRVYAKSKNLYQVDEDGLETNLNTTGGVGADHDHTTAGDGGVLTNDAHDGYSDFTQISTPATPSSGHTRLYAKSDDRLYQKDDGGTESKLAVAADVPADISAATFLTVVPESGLSAEQAIRNLLPYNEFYWPPMVPLLTDLDAAAHWWRKVATPTGGVIFTKATTEAVSTLYGEELLKVVSAASGDGLKTTWTYANEKRVKSGAYQAILCAVYIVTAARTLTVSLISSVPTTIATQATSTVGSWVLIALEPGATALDGTTVTFQATLNGTGTFYVIPLGAIISTAASPRALPMPNRGLVYRHKDAGTTALTVTGDNDTNTYTDNDLTATTSALATMAQLQVSINEAVSGFDFYVRRNGDSGGSGAVASTAPASQFSRNEVLVVLDDAQIWEYKVDRYVGSSTLDFGEIYLNGYYEWA